MNSYCNSMSTIIVSEKGQITIPKALREKMGIRPGTVLDFEATEGALVGRKKMESDIFAKWRGRGRLPLSLDVDTYLRRARDDYRD